MSGRLDAVLEFTIFICREFLLNNYALEKHQSDVFDQFQLQYLAFQQFVIVTADPDLSKRTQESSQSTTDHDFPTVPGYYLIAEGLSELSCLFTRRVHFKLFDWLSHPQLGVRQPVPSLHSLFD